MPKNDVRRVSLKQFKQAIEEKDNLEKLAPVKGVALELEKATEEDDNDRILTFTLSTGDVDRDGDTLNPHGWELDNFAKGGSMLWAHDPKIVIAKPLATWVESNKLKGRAQFMPKDMNAFSFMLYQMFREQYVRGVSVGFIPKKWSENAERAGWMPIDFEKQELLEYSGTPIPSNPNAVAEAKSKGIDVAPFVKWVEPILDDDETASGLLISRELAEEMYRSARGDAPTTVEIQADAGGDSKTADSDSPEGHGASVGGGQSKSAGDSRPLSAATILDGMTERVDRACELIAKEATELAADIKALLAIIGKADKALSDSAIALLREARESLDQVIGEEKTESTEPVTTDTDDGIELDFDIEPRSPEASFELDSKDVADAIGEVVTHHVDSAIRAAQGRVD